MWWRCWEQASSAGIEPEPLRPLGTRFTITNHDFVLDIAVCHLRSSVVGRFLSECTALPARRDGKNNAHRGARVSPQKQFTRRGGPLTPALFELDLR